MKKSTNFAVLSFPTMFFNKKLFKNKILTKISILVKSISNDNK